MLGLKICRFIALKICQQRKSLFLHSKNYFLKNLLLFEKGLSSQSVIYNLQFGKNLIRLMPNYSRFRQIKQNLLILNENWRVQNLVDILYLISNSSLDGSQQTLLKKIKQYIQTFFLLFTQRDIKKMESYMFGMMMKNYKIKQLEFSIKELKNKQMVNKSYAITRKQQILKKLKINQSNQIKITYKSDDQIIIKFPNFNKILYLYGVQHDQMESVLKMKRLCHKINNKTLFIQLPLYQTKLNQDDPQVKYPFNFQMILQNKQIKQKYSVIDQQLLKKYIQNYVAKRKNFFKINSNQKIVYHWDNYWIPHDFVTILYLLYSLNKQVKIVFCDLTLKQQIMSYVQSKSLDSIQQQFAFLRLLFFQHQLNYISNVYKNGCRKCSVKSNQKILSPVNIADQKYYDLSVRQKFMSKTIYQYIRNSGSQQQFFGIFGNDHLIPITKYIVQNSKQGRKKNIQNLNSQLNQYILSLRPKQNNQPFIQNKSEYIQKYSIISAILNEDQNNEKKDNYPFLINQNKQDYLKLKKNYSYLLSLNSFLGLKQKQKIDCYAKKVLFRI